MGCVLRPCSFHNFPVPVLADIGTRPDKRERARRYPVTP